MPSIPFFSKKAETAAATTEGAPAEPTGETPVAPAAPAAAVQATESTPAESEASAPAAEKPAESKRTSFFGRRKQSSDATASESESEATSPTSRIPFFRKSKPTPAPVLESDKENVPDVPAPAADPAPAAPTTTEETAPAEKKEGDKVEEKVRRRISLFQRRNRTESEGEVTDEEKTKAKRTSFWKASTPEKKDEPTEPAPEDPRLTEAKSKITELTEAETTAKATLEAARKALRDAKTSLKTLESEISAEKRKKVVKEEKKDEVKPAEAAAAAPQTAIEPPALPTITASA